MCAACAWIGQHIAEVSFGGCQLRRRWTCRRRIMATNEKESEGCRIERRCALISTLNICQKISMEQWSAAPFRSMSQLSSSFSVRPFFVFNSFLPQLSGNDVRTFSQCHLLLGRMRRERGAKSFFSHNCGLKNGSSGLLIETCQIANFCLRFAFFFVNLINPRWCEDFFLFSMGLCSFFMISFFVL